MDDPQRFSGGVQFDFNYTYSNRSTWRLFRRTMPPLPDSFPRGSTSIINSWFTNDMKSRLDYDVQHNFSAL